MIFLCNLSMWRGGTVTYQNGHVDRSCLNTFLTDGYNLYFGETKIPEFKFHSQIAVRELHRTPHAFFENVRLDYSRGGEFELRTVEEKKLDRRVVTIVASEVPVQFDVKTAIYIAKNGRARMPEELKLGDPEIIIQNRTFGPGGESVWTYVVSCDHPFEVRQDGGKRYKIYPSLMNVEEIQI